MCLCTVDVFLKTAQRIFKTTFCGCVYQRGRQEVSHDHETTFHVPPCQHSLAALPLRSPRSAREGAVSAGSTLAVAPRWARLEENNPRDPRCLSRVEHASAHPSTVLAEASRRSLPVAPGHKLGGPRASPGRPCSCGSTSLGGRGLIDAEARGSSCGPVSVSIDMSVWLEVVCSCVA